MRTIFLLFATITLVNSFILPHSTRQKSAKKNDVIAEYILQPEFSLAFSQVGCLKTQAFKQFDHDVALAPAHFPAPRQFNARIPHIATRAGGRSCESTGYIEAVESGHPFARNSIPTIIDTWCRGGATAITAEASKMCVPALVLGMQQFPFVFAYDWDIRSCGGNVVKAGTGYMFITPTFDINLATQPNITQSLLEGEKYLITTRRGFGGACVYRQLVDLGPAPPKDPSLDKIKEGSLTTEAAPVANGSVAANRPTEDGASPDEEGADGNATRPLRPTSPDAEDPPGTGDGSTGPAAPAIEGSFGDSTGLTDPIPASSSRGFPKCFPASSTLTLSSGASVKMASLRVGHHVLARAGHHSPVFTFSHADAEHVTRFTRIAAANDAVLTLSPGHYLYVNDVLIPARSVRVGDSIETNTGHKVLVTSVSSIHALGLYAPHSMDGDLIVDGIRVSSYTEALHPTLAHNLLAPLRVAYRLGVHIPIHRVLPHLGRILSSFR